jgi:hypothetical protein
VGAGMGEALVVVLKNLEDLPLARKKKKKKSSKIYHRTVAQHQRFSVLHLISPHHFLFGPLLLAIAEVFFA